MLKFDSCQRTEERFESNSHNFKHRVPFVIRVIYLWDNLHSKQKTQKITDLKQMIARIVSAIESPNFRKVPKGRRLFLIREKNFVFVVLIYCMIIIFSSQTIAL